MNKSRCLSLILFACLPLCTFGQEDHALVQAAIQDYVDALYQVKPELIERSVDTTLRKIGFWYDTESHSYQDNLPMTYQQLYDLAGSWNTNGNRITDRSPQEIIIYEVNDKPRPPN